MRSGSVALAPRPSGKGTSTLLDVVERPGSALPEWVRSWRSHMGFEVTRRPMMPGPASELCPGASGGWPRVIDDVACSTAAGRTVLVSHPLRRAAHPGPVVASVGDGVDDADALADAARCAVALGSELLLVHGVPMSFAERSVGVESAVRHGRDLLDAALTFVWREDPSVTVSSTVLRAHPHELVSSRLHARLLVVGGARVGSAGRLGPVALGAVQHAPCPVLVVPRGPRDVVDATVNG
ncbi:universal stress protein [Pseudonocardia spinosispora]|uniref:universal stress protein n=1 Tax=Pseudonocardia spinosispora TaxID=103441 RepID=UPI000411C9E6|nr:universal stress protein [Pseudonocardia spinosispora]